MALHDLLALIWARLDGAGNPARAAFRLLQAASIDADGAPSVRTVVLREVMAAEHRIRFYSDMRSPKIAELQRAPRIALVGYDTAQRTQLRMAGVATLAKEADRRRAWDALSAHNLIDYRSTVAPGTALPCPPDALPARGEGEGKSNGDSGERNAGYEHFAIVDISLTMLDWLDLSDNTRHIRARFDRHGTAWQGAWIAP